MISLDTNRDNITENDIEENIIETNAQGTESTPKRGEQAWVNNESISSYDATTTPTSSFNIFLGKRRSGKSVLCEYFIKQLIENKQLDFVYLLSETSAGFDCIDPQNKFTDITFLQNLIENMKKINTLNKVVSKKDQVKMRIMVVLDDCAIKLKSKEFNILEEIAVNGRHYSYEPCALHFCVLAQSLTKIPRVVRLNCDNIFLNAIASAKEKEMVMDENMYIIDNSVQGKKYAREVYQGIVLSEDYQFMVIENYKQNVRKYSDYLKTYKAIL
tara:strand:+ start:121 stop:936 length:816 start_codon:yes stop_codon:yes gene_type:complete